jgi:hypothetical protein
MPKSALVASLLAACSSPSEARIVENSKDLLSALKAPSVGEVIKLQGDGFGDILVSNIHFTTPVTIDASAVALSIRIQGVSGLIIKGGRLRAGVGGRAVVIDRSEDVSIIGGTIDDATDGVTIVRSRKVSVDAVHTSRIAGNAFTVAGSQHVSLTNGSCRDQVRHPTLHPDCVQVWSLPGNVTTDLSIKGFDITGFGQGIFIKNPPSQTADIGFDRISISSNIVMTTDAPNGISLHECRACTVVNNTVGTASGSKWQTRIYIAGGAVMRRANNVRSYSRWRGERD